MGLAKRVSAKTILGSKIHYPGYSDGQVDAEGNRVAEKELWYLSWYPDYNDAANKEWASASPSLSFSMTVRGDVADKLEQGRKYTVYFELEDEKEVPDGDGSA